MAVSSVGWPYLRIWLQQRLVIAFLRILTFDILIYFRISDAPKRTTAAPKRIKREHCPCKFAAAKDHPNRDCIQDGSFDTFIC